MRFLSLSSTTILADSFPSSVDLGLENLKTNTYREKRPKFYTMAPFWDRYFVTVQGTPFAKIVEAEAEAGASPHSDMNFNDEQPSNAHAFCPRGL